MKISVKLEWKLVTISVVLWGSSWLISSLIKLLYMFSISEVIDRCSWCSLLATVASSVLFCVISYWLRPLGSIVVYDILVSVFYHCFQFDFICFAYLSCICSCVSHWKVNIYFWYLFHGSHILSCRTFSKLWLFFFEGSDATFLSKRGSAGEGVADVVAR